MTIEAMSGLEPLIHPLIHSGLSWALTYAIHSTLLIGGVWLVCRGIRPLAARIGPAFENRAWKLALVGGLVTATVQVGAGLTPEFAAFELPGSQELTAASDPVAPPPATVQTTTRTVTASATAAATATSSPHHHGIRGHVVHGERELLLLDDGELVALHSGSGSALAPLAPPVTSIVRVHTAPVLASAPALAAVAPATPAGPAPVWPTILAGLWLVGAALALTRLGRSVLALRRSLAPRVEVLEDPVLESFLTLCRDAQLRRKVRLTQIAGLGSPIALWAKEIVVPERAVDELSPAAMRSALAHELAHLERRDPHWLALAALVESLLFFQPLNRVARRGMQESAELLCDDWAIARTGDGVSFAKALAELAGWAKARQPSALVAGMISDERPLLRRVRRALDGDPARLRPEGQRPARIALGLGALAALVVFAPGVVNAGDPETETKAKAKVEGARTDADVEDSAKDSRAEARRQRRARKQMASAEKKALRAREKARSAQLRAREASERAHRATREALRAARIAERDARHQAPVAPEHGPFIHIQDGEEIVILDRRGLRIHSADGEVVIIEGDDSPRLHIEIPDEGVDFDFDFGHPGATLEGLESLVAPLEELRVLELLGEELSEELTEELGEELGEEIAGLLLQQLENQLELHGEEQSKRELERAKHDQDRAKHDQDRAKHDRDRSERHKERAEETIARELERAERELQRLQRELERAKREQDRAKHERPKAPKDAS